MIASAAFSRYVDRAREGRTELWRFAVGIVLAVAVWAAFTFAALFAGSFASGLVQSLFSGGGAIDDPMTLVQRFLASPIGVASALGSFLGLSIGVFLAVKLLQRRAFSGVLGAHGRLSWHDMARGFVAAIVASALAELPTFLVDPSLRRSAIGIGAWLAWLVPLMLLLFIQVSAEELAFRGYLMQTLAARFRSPLAWALIPILVFTLLHWDAQSSASMEAAMLITIAAFAVTATVLVLRTGNLGAGIGAHLGLNTFGIMVVSHASWLSGGALFEGAPLNVGNWSGFDALLLGIFGVASFALMLLFLLHPRSPLKVEAATDSLA